MRVAAVAAPAELTRAHPGGTGAVTSQSLIRKIKLSGALAH